MQYYIMIFVSVVLLALQFSTNKTYQLKYGDSAEASLRFTCLSGFLTSALFLVLTIAMGEEIRITGYSVLSASLIALLCCIYTFIGFKILSFGSMSVFMMFLMLGGMMLPFLFGIAFLNEPVSVFRIIGVVLLAVSMIFPVISRDQRGGLIFALLCLLVFVLNGSVSILSKLHQINETYETCGTNMFVCINNLMNGVFSGIGYLFIRIGNKSKNESTAPEKQAAEKSASSILAKLPLPIIIAANSVFSGVSYMLQLVGATNVPASMLYPLITGGSVVLSALAGYVFFHEKPNRNTAIGLLLSFAATFLFLF